VSINAYNNPLIVPKRASKDKKRPFAIILESKTVELIIFRIPLAMKSLLLFLSIMGLFCFQAVAQPGNDNCTQSTSLCAGITYSFSNSGAGTETADGAGFSCFSANNSIWFSFTTNAAGGAVTISLSNISCIAGAGNDTELQAVLISATTPCDPATYTELGNCISAASSSATISALGLLPSNTYYVVVDGDLNGAGITNPAECSFDVVVDGESVEWTATTAETPQTCGATDGQIVVNTMDGGSAPYQYALNTGAFQASNTFSNLSSGVYSVNVTDADGCVQTVDVVTLNQVNGPSGSTPLVADANCGAADGSITVNGTSGGTLPYLFILNGGTPQASNSFPGLPAGSYNIVVSDAAGCFEVLSATINNSSGISATVSTTAPHCGQTDGAIAVTVNGGTNPITFSLNGGVGQAQNTFSALAPGPYSVTVTDAAGCTYTVNAIVLTEQVSNLAPSVSISALPNPACTGDNITITATAQNAGTPTYDFTVNGISVQNGASNVFSSSTLNTGDVVECAITVTDPCSPFSSAVSSAQTLTINPIVNPTVTLVSSATSGCTYDQITLTATETGCSGTPSFQWLVNGTPFAADTIGVLTSTFGSDAAVSVNLTCSDPCSTPASSNTINLTITEVTADAGPNQIITPGESAVLNGSGGGTYSWAPGSTLSDPTSATTIASPVATTTYFLDVTINGCTDQDEVTVYVVQPIQVPNTFTPNSDGTNDTWQIQNIENYPNCKVTVYDRWGQKVYNSIGYSNANAWDGTSKTGRLPASTYYYVIDLNSGSGNSDAQIFSGSITLVY
jgi:gliding motility-associated-like protein